MNKVTDSSAGAARWNVPDPTPRALKAPTPSAARSLSDLPDGDPNAIARAARASTSSVARPASSPSPAPHMILAMGVDVEGVRYGPIGKRLDDFLARATPTLHTPEGDVKVPIPFRMVPGGSMSPAYAQTEERVITNSHVLARIAVAIGLTGRDLDAVVAGRGTPEQVTRLTQALIDAGRCPPASAGCSLEDRIRRMMADHGLGLDCAGYSQQAFLASRELSRNKTRLNPKVTNENLLGLASKGFRRVAPDDAKPGDLFILARRNPRDASEVGHTVIVRDCTYASPLQIAEYHRAGLAPSFGRGFVTVLHVDSSWGSGGDPRYGGVGRRTWIHDVQTGEWAEIDGARAFPTPGGPYRHPIDGVYRLKGEP